jgi:beta-N-acetylhexosaminidase
MRSFLTALFIITSLQIVNAQDSLDIKIGQMILIGLPAAKVDQNILAQVRSGKVGSILFFEKNIPARNSFMEVKKIIWTYEKAAPIPLFVAIDQEGGKVNRLKEKYGFPRSITAAKMGKHTLDSVRFYSETTAATLAGLGFNVNFAPVVDLASNPDNPIIAKLERAFSAQPDSVALYAKEFMKAHQKLGVITVLKHFPGHGSSTKDTHKEITDVSNTWNDSELKPYQILIDSGYAEAIMSAHIVNKKLDDRGLPGTLSQKIITDLLRTKLGYNGVVFTDDMQMHAITKYYGLEESVRLSIEAGVDILLFSNNIQGSQQQTVDKVHQIIRKLVDTGKLPESRIDQSFKRIMVLKQTLSSSREEHYRSEMVKMQQALREQERRAEENARMATDSALRAKEKYEQLLEEQQKSGKRKKKSSN